MAIAEKSIVNTGSASEELEYKIEIATQTLERNIGFVTNCDNKTSIVLAAIGVLLTIILTDDGLKEIFNIIRICIGDKATGNSFYLICLGVSSAITILGMFNLGSVLVAKTSEEASGFDGINSRIFFSGIRENEEYKTYRSRFYSMKREELLDELIAQIYINADIAARKYEKYNFGFKCTIIGFLLFVIILLIGIYRY